MGTAFLQETAAAQHLKSGAVLLMATDTLPGLHCRADDASAVAKIVGMKGRETEKSLLVLAGSLDQALSVVGELTPAQKAACAACWPGPFSLILPAGSKLASQVCAGRKTLAIRVPLRQDLRSLLLRVGVSLVSTSANRAGEPPALTIEAAQRLFGASVAGVWRGQDDSPSEPKPSALVDLTSDPFVVLRPGPEPFSLG